MSAAEETANVPRADPPTLTGEDEQVTGASEPVATTSSDVASLDVKTDAASPSDPASTKTASNPAPASLSAPATATPFPASPAKRRPKPPTKGILKPAPPPAKPTLGNRLRDIVGGAVTTAVGTTTRLFDAAEEAGLASGAGGGAGPSSSSSGPGGRLRQVTSEVLASTTASSAGNPASGGTLASLSGRLAGLGSRFVSTASNAAGLSSPIASPGPSSPMPSRSISLPDTGPSAPASGSGGTAMATAATSDTIKQKQPLRRATFVLPSLSITYPISSHGEPWSVMVLADRERVESNHWDQLTKCTGPDHWTPPRPGIVRALELIPPAPRPRHIRLTLRPIDHTTIGVPPPPPPAPNTLDTPLTRYAAESLADVLSAEWGLTELKLEGGVVESEEALKPILHALLISGTLPVLGLAGNRKIKAGGWRLLAVFLKRARSLRYVDLSDTVWDKKSVEYLVQALTCSQIRAPPTADVSASGLVETDTGARSISPINSQTRTSENRDDTDRKRPNVYGSFVPPAPLLKEADESSMPAAVQTLRMDGCTLKAGALETLAHGVRSSDLKNISLRRNKIGPLGAVALALMIRDYPDASLGISSWTPSSGGSSSPAASTPTTATIALPASGQLAYAARARRPETSTSAENEERDLPPIPLVVSSPTGGVTTRTLPDGYKPPLPPKNPLIVPGGNDGLSELGGLPVSHAMAEGRMTSVELGGASMALQRSVRALDSVERIGRLLTLDLKSNDIRNGVNYIAQVLKRNRTLKVLNLSDNRIDSTGLTVLAEALKYNSTLETLDLSSNPCCGSGGEGVATLRTAFTVNTALKRLFLADTGLTTDGAIALAEFLPESRSLLHLDLTSNPAIETAGILAISVGLKSNKMIRCLDISIPPNSTDLAELSQHILQSCIRNTELAAEAVTAAKEGSTKSRGQASEAIWGPIKKSELVRQVKEADQARADKERMDIAQSPEGVAREYVYTLRPERVLIVSEEVARDLQRWYDAGSVYKALGREFRAWEPGQLPKEDFATLYERAKVLSERIIDQVQETVEAESLERLLSLNDLLSSSVDSGKNFRPPPRLLLPSQIVPTESAPSASLSPMPAHRDARDPRHASPSPSPGIPMNGAGRAFQSRRHMRISSTEISSPNFSIGDSDNDSDAEELDVGSLDSRSNLTPSKVAAVNTRGLGLGQVSPTATTTKLGPTMTDVEGGAEASGVSLVPGLVGPPTGGDLEITSPVEKVSKAWVEEEGEIFRKGTKLGLVEEDGDEEVSGEDLRKEILDTPVARSPTRRVISEEGEDGADGVDDLDGGETK
ncbi:hypothetical protein IAU60_001945 [Kwoniella sp. DSM 27419]